MSNKCQNVFTEKDDPVCQSCYLKETDIFSSGKMSELKLKIDNIKKKYVEKLKPLEEEYANQIRKEYKYMYRVHRMKDNGHTHINYFYFDQESAVYKCTYYTNVSYQLSRHATLYLDYKILSNPGENIGFY